MQREIFQDRLGEGTYVGAFRQKQHIKDKITIASLKNISENKILKWA